ncbi:MAG: hypothetical protein CSA68_07020 [Rhodobacterales bacterium]|nr:MAG: hypothetical protein CSA68_07020 [Rhodobacterales bacterium]
MKMLKTVGLIAVVSVLAACEGGEGLRQVGPDKSVDKGYDKRHLSEMVAGVWVNPDGCDVWMIDNGVEGYAMARLQPDGTPVCSGVNPPNVVTGPFKKGSIFPDYL